ncbi:MAG: FecR family protein [Leptolyngbyaceae cyanobacterium bins.302]|nr:FecR family protein [Leptolyngbyaceae cyanobacterium bins.302]
MASRTLLNLVTSLCCAGSMVFALPVSAETLLTQATIQRLRANVELHLKQKGVKRQAQKADVMIPGDALLTYKQAMAELRFNDRSLARIGEQAIFQFEPNTRNFDLRRGTVLLLIKPGQGKTRVRTPNAAAGIRGSALFVRYIEDSNVTMVGALTNSDIEISNSKGESVVLKAGQLAYVYQDRIGVYNFDQKLFQETSPFFKEIDWNEAPEEVKEEITAALQGQQPVAGKFEDSPAWTKLAENRSVPAPVAVQAPQAVAFERVPGSTFPTSNPNPTTLNQPSGNIPQEIPANLPTNPPVAANPITQPPVTTPGPPPGTRPAPMPETRPTPESRPTPETQAVPQIPVTPPVQVAPPTNTTPSAVNPPTRPVASPPPAPSTPVASPPPAPSTPVVTQPSRPSPVVTPPAATPATPAVPATPTTPAVPAVPATPAPVAPTATPIVNSAPVAASVAPPAVAPPVVPVTPPAVATPPATPPAVPAAPATPPATAPSDLPQAVPSTTPAASVSVTTSVTVTPAATPATTTPATTPASDAAPATRAVIP